MAESRRVQLTTLSSDGPVLPGRSASVRRSPSGVLQRKADRPGSPADPQTVPRTVRLVLALFEPDAQSFPEFNYAQLLESKINQTEDEVHLTRLEQEEKREIDEVAAVAKRLEEKYGSRHKKKDRIQDLIDIGYGYDDEDSFIDNSEAYDEFVPSSITTKFGGFYVNSGMLQFRQASDAETDDLPTEERTFKSTKKRHLSGEQDKPKKQQCRTNEVNSNADLKLRSETGSAEMKTKKNKKAVKMLSVTSMLKKFQREKERQKMERAKQTAAAAESGPTTPLLPADAAGGGGSGLTDPILSLIGSTNDHALIQAASTVEFDLDLDSLFDTEGTLSPKTEMILTRMDDPTPVNILPDAEDRNTTTCSQLEPHPEQSQLSEPSFMLPHDCEPLPEGLPPGLEDNIRKLVVVQLVNSEAAKISEGESKLKFFNPDVNSILLDIELQCQEQGGQLRSKVYRYLSSFLPCSKDTLLKRVRKLLIVHVKDGEEPPSVEHPMQKLKESIGRAMPEQLACFHENYQAYEQSKALKTTEEQNVDEKSGRRGVPKKLFKWNKEIRECLGHVLKEKMDAYKANGGQEAEERLKTLLNDEIKPLWPKGWMQSRVLIRESRKLLDLSAAQMSNVLRVNKVKCLRKTSSVSGASKSSDGCKGLQGPPALSDLHSGTDDVLKDSDVSLCVFLDAALKQSGVQMESGACSSAAESEKPPVNPVPASLPLDILANQDLVHEQPLAFSHEFLTAALTKHKTSRNGKSPPPAPQSSPVDFPGSGGSGCFTSAVAGWTRETSGCWPEADEH